MIYTLSSNASFCDMLAEKWLQQSQNDVWGLSKMTVVLPTNRAAKTFKEAFLRQSGGKTLLLPKIISFADLNFFKENLPEPISPLERQFILAKLIKQKQPMTEDKAFSLASSLAELIDEMHHYDVTFENFKDIAPENFAAHWQDTLSFLQIIETFWNEILKEKNKIDPSLYQIRQVESLINEWQKNPPQGIINAVGFTGGLPIVEKFLKAVSALPNGNIYVPDLDDSLPQEIWESVAETHPQFYFNKLLQAIDIKRKNIESLTNKSTRFDLLSTALIPSEKTDIWQEKLNIKADKNLCLIECETPQTEAFEIASILRGVLETPEKTAALVTTDRQLARRVKAQMQKWDILLDDSAGTPLSLTPIGTFLILLANAATTQKQTDLLSVLKHPLCLDGEDFASFRKRVHQAEKAARKKQKPMEMPLKTDLSPLMNLFINPTRIPFEVILKAHLQVAQSLAASTDRTGAERLWDKEAGQVASDLLADVLKNADIIGDIEPAFYADLFEAILKTVTVRPKYGMHPRLDILGPIEARLQQPDLIVIGGLNEGTFPQMPTADNWINRPMRKACGLPLPEEKIGVAAQDFMHLMQAPEVIMTRALKVDGTPSIPSRWLVRLQTVLQKANQTLATYSEGYIKLALSTERLPPQERPAPVPPVDARPDVLSISDICTFLQDPYSIYAKHILKLYKLKELQEAPNEASFGNAVHNALAAFLSLPEKEQTPEKLLSLGDFYFEQEGFNTSSNAFFKPKFEKIAHWFIAEQNNILPKASYSLLETTAQMELALKDRTFTLKGRADRIDVFGNSANIIDYKTGAAPTASQVLKGFAPQLPLEALMLKEKCFDKQIKSINPERLSYWRINGKNEGGEIKDVTPAAKTISIVTFLEETKARLIGLLQEYQKKETSYPACPKPAFQPRYNDYAHLERLSEWQESEEE